MYAIVEFSGKQYKVEKDGIINVDRVKSGKPEEIIFDKILMFSDGKKTIIGQPYIENAKVKAKVLGEIKGEKVRGIKFKKRKRYTRTLGHRQKFLQVKIDELAVS